jgi:hypothetical protein
MKSRNLTLTALLCGALAALGGCTTPKPASLVESAATPLEQCEQVTGSRIRPASRSGNAADCEPMGHPFRSYSAEDLQSTGEMNLSDALRQLDPAFR